jgi:hydroxymethylglutaryl-CoA synthase
MGNKKMRKIGIVSYGTYIPKYRLKIADIAKAWKKVPDEIVNSLGIKEKSVPGVDEDAVTMGVEAGFSALKSFKFLPSKVETVLVGSESHPYAVNPSSTIVGELLGLGPNYLAADLEFACKAGSAAIQMIAGLISSSHIDYGLAIGADTAQSKTHDALEYTSASGSGAFLLGSGEVAAELLDYTSFSSDTPDFWRRDGISYPSHAGRFTGEPAYFAHVMGAAKLLLEKTHIKPEAVNNCIFHMPNAKFPRDVAGRIGFTPKQLQPSLIVDEIGNPYSASSLLGLAATLDQAKIGDLIFMVSYGSGAGSDAFLWRVNKEIVQIQGYRKKNKLCVQDQIKDKIYVDYTRYLQQTHKI